MPRCGTPSLKKAPSSAATARPGSCSPRPPCWTPTRRRPSEEIVCALSGNICRCTGYTQDPARPSRSPPAEVGQHDRHKVDRTANAATGCPGQGDRCASSTGWTSRSRASSYGAILRSPHPHALHSVDRHEPRPRPRGRGSRPDRPSDLSGRPADARGRLGSATPGLGARALPRRTGRRRGGPTPAHRPTRLWS